MSPDVSAIAQDRWNSLTPEQRRKIVPLCPDFVLKLKSPNDRLKDAKEKMDDWIANGCRLGWLIDPDGRKTYVYRAGQGAQEVNGLGQLSGEDVLPGFILDLAALG